MPATVQEWQGALRGLLSKSAGARGHFLPRLDEAASSCHPQHWAGNPKIVFLCNAQLRLLRAALKIKGLGTCKTKAAATPAGLEQLVFRDTSVK